MKKLVKKGTRVLHDEFGFGTVKSANDYTAHVIWDNGKESKNIPLRRVAIWEVL